MQQYDETQLKEPLQQPVLWLIPTPLDFGTDKTVALESIIPSEVIAQAVKITHWIVENAKTARSVLKRLHEITPLTVPLQDMVITELPREVHKKGDAGFDARKLLKSAALGKDGSIHDVGLMSEAGLPAIADPGSSIVLAAHQLGMKVQPFVGPSSLLLALMGSGLNGQNFAFTGYLPKEGAERHKRIKELEKLAIQHNQTQLFIETPYRNEAMLDALLKTLSPNTYLSVAFGMTLPKAKQITLRVIDWKSQSNWRKMDLTESVIKLPAVFIIGK